MKTFSSRLICGQIIRSTIRADLARRRRSIAPTASADSISAICRQLDLSHAAPPSDLTTAQIGVTDVFFELFDATHMAIEYRYALGLKYLGERL